jgi:hypothetical protein
MSKLVVWSSKYLIAVAVFADYLERHGCQVISVVPPQGLDCFTRVFARAPKDFDSMFERSRAIDTIFAPGMDLRDFDLSAGRSEDYQLESYLDLARRGDS